MGVGDKAVEDVEVEEESEVEAEEAEVEVEVESVSPGGHGCNPLQPLTFIVPSCDGPVVRLGVGLIREDEDALPALVLEEDDAVEVALAMIEDASSGVMV